MASHTNSKITYINVPNSSGTNTKYDVHDGCAVHSSSEIVFNDTTINNFKDPMMSYIISYAGDYRNILVEDGNYLYTETSQDVGIDLLGLYTAVSTEPVTVNRNSIPSSFTDNTIYNISGNLTGIITIPDAPASNVNGVIVKFTAGDSCTLSFASTPTWIGYAPTTTLTSGSKYHLAILDNVWRLCELITK